jgi:Ca2+-binding EF-hand superfamily protein
MGCGSSAFDAFMHNEQSTEMMDQFTAMQLRKSDVQKLFDVFSTVDVDGSGTIGIAELLTFLDLDRTQFTEKVFSIFDDNKSGDIDFKEFVMSLWNYCTLTKITLGKSL